MDVQLSRASNNTSSEDIMSKDDIAAQTAKFLADGGKVTKVGTIIHTNSGSRTQAENREDMSRATAAITQNRADKRNAKRKAKT